MQIRSRLLLVIALICAAMPLRAEEGLSSASIAELADKLALSEKQRERVNTLIVRYAAKAADLQKESVSLREDMQRQPLDKMSRSSIAAMSQRAGSVAARHTGAILHTQMQFYRLLTPKQKAEYRRLREAGQQQSGLSSGS